MTSYVSVKLEVSIRNAIDLGKLTRSLPKFKLDQTYCRPKRNSFQNNDGNANKLESLKVQSIAVTTGVGVTNNIQPKQVLKADGESEGTNLW